MLHSYHFFKQNPTHFQIQKETSPQKRNPNSKSLSLFYSNSKLFYILVVNVAVSVCCPEKGDFLSLMFSSFSLGFHLSIDKLLCRLTWLECQKSCISSLLVCSCIFIQYSSDSFHGGLVLVKILSYTSLIMKEISFMTFQ